MLFDGVIYDINHRPCDNIILVDAMFWFFVGRVFYLREQGKKLSETVWRLVFLLVLFLLIWSLNDMDSFFTILFWGVISALLYFQERKA